MIGATAFGNSVMNANPFSGAGRPALPLYIYHLFTRKTPTASVRESSAPGPAAWC